MEYMVLLKFTLDAVKKDILEASQVCVGKLEQEAIRNRKYVEKAIQDTIK